MYQINPAVGEIQPRHEILLRAEELRLEAADLAGGTGLFLRLARASADLVARGGINAQPIGIVDVDLAPQSAVDRLPQQG